jgi:hypothetical protein
VTKEMTLAIGDTNGRTNGGGMDASVIGSPDNASFTLDVLCRETLVKVDVHVSISP